MTRSEYWKLKIKEFNPKIDVQFVGFADEDDVICSIDGMIILERMRINRAYDFLVNKKITLRIEILRRDSNYGSSIYFRLNPYRLLGMVTEYIIETYAIKIGCPPPKWIESPSRKEIQSPVKLEFGGFSQDYTMLDVDEVTYYNNYDFYALYSTLVDAIEKLGYTVEFDDRYYVYGNDFTRADYDAAVSKRKLMMSLVSNDRVVSRPMRKM